MANPDEENRSRATVSWGRLKRPIGAYGQHIFYDYNAVFFSLRTMPTDTQIQTSNAMFHPKPIPGVISRIFVHILCQGSIIGFLLLTIHSIGLEVTQHGMPVLKSYNNYK